MITALYLLFISGQLGIDPANGEFAGQQTAAQANQALQNITAADLSSENAKVKIGAIASVN